MIIAKLSQRCCCDAGKLSHFEVGGNVRGNTSIKVDVEGGLSGWDDERAKTRRVMKNGEMTIYIFDVSLCKDIVKSLNLDERIFNWRKQEF